MFSMFFWEGVAGVRGVILLMLTADAFREPTSLVLCLFFLSVSRVCSNGGVESVFGYSGVSWCRFCVLMRPKMP